MRWPMTSRPGSSPLRGEYQTFNIIELGWTGIIPTTWGVLEPRGQGDGDRGIIPTTWGVRVRPTFSSTSSRIIPTTWGVHGP